MGSLANWGSSTDGIVHESWSSYWTWCSPNKFLSSYRGERRVKRAYWNLWLLKSSAQLHRPYDRRQMLWQFRKESIQKRETYEKSSLLAEKKCSQIPSTVLLCAKKHSQHTRVFPFVWTTTQVEWTLNACIHIYEKEKEKWSLNTRKQRKCKFS